MKITIDVQCGRKRCELCHLYSAAVMPARYADGAQMGINSKKSWHCSAIPGPLEMGTDGRPLRSQACRDAEVRDGA